MANLSGRDFTVRPFGSKANSIGEDPINFNRVHKELISAALS
jgi:hypothetical protein